MRNFLDNEKAARLVRLGFGMRGKVVDLVEYIGARELEKHAPSLGDPVLTPFRYRCRLNFAKLGSFARPAKGIDDLAVGVSSIHASIFRHA